MGKSKNKNYNPSEKAPPIQAIVSPPVIYRPATPPPEYPKPYFFYGPLTSPKILQTVLSLPSSPTLIPARIYDHAILLWDKLPALLHDQGCFCIHDEDSKCRPKVEGLVYIVRTKEHEEKLKEYEGPNYYVKQVEIYTEKAKGKLGHTFMWFRSSGNVTKLEYGDWDLNTWEKENGEEMRSYKRAIGSGGGGIEGVGGDI